MWTLVQLWWGSGSFINPDTCYSDIVQQFLYSSTGRYSIQQWCCPHTLTRGGLWWYQYSLQVWSTSCPRVTGGYWPNSIMTLFIRMSFAIKLRRDIITNLSISQTTSTARCYVNTLVRTLLTFSVVYFCVVKGNTQFDLIYPLGLVWQGWLVVTWANALTKKQDTIPDQHIVNIDELLWTLILFLLLLLQNDLF